MRLGKTYTHTKRNRMNRPLVAIALALCMLSFALLAGCTMQDAQDASPSAQSTTQQESSGGQDCSTDSSDNSSSQSTSQNSSDCASGETTELGSQLKAVIKRSTKKSGMDVGTYVVDLGSGTRVDVNGDKRMVAASMIKLPIAASVLEHAEAGEFSLNDHYVLDEKDIAGGTGSLGGRGAGAEVTYAELLEKMIAESDNTATNALISAVGKDEINKTASSLGLKKTKLNRLMMDEDAMAEGIENYTSANDIGTILELAYRGKLVSPKASKTLIKALKRQTDKDGLLDGLPKNVTFAHKTGELSNAAHDGGIVYATVGGEDRDFVIVVMCGGSGFSLDGAYDVMADIGKQVSEILAV